MKKTYIKPSVKVIEVEVESLCMTVSGETIVTNIEDIQEGASRSTLWGED